MASLEINIDYLSKVNYSLLHNHAKVCKSIDLKNVGANQLSQIQIKCQGEYLNPTVSDVYPFINRNTSLRPHDFEISLNSGKLLSLTERVVSSFTITVYAGDEKIFENTFPLEIMAYDQWPGLLVMPQTITSFVTPNHPAISALVVKAAQILNKATGSTNFYSYQTGNTNDVLTQVQAIFEATQQCGIVYRELAASYESEGQRVSMPDKVLSSRLGNCLELSVLLASALEAVGINSGLAFYQGHAFIAAWLNPNSCPVNLCDDAQWFEDQCQPGGELIAIESTFVTHEDATFEQAMETASNYLPQHDKFHAFVDIKRCRIDKFLPLPSVIMSNGVYTIDPESASSCSENINSTEYDRYDLTALCEASRTLTKFDIWERKLLDFSLRSSLLNLYLRKRAVQFISFGIDRIEDSLQDGKEYCLMPKPGMMRAIENNKFLTRSTQFDDIRQTIEQDINEHQLHTYLTDSESQSVLKNIYRAARNAIEETGANSLFLAIGALRWFETPQSDTPHFAPLMLLPVDMLYKRGHYFIRSREEDITLNITLIEFLRQNYDINILGLNPLPKDANGVDVNLILAALREAIKHQARWEIEEECILGTFSFNKFLMWNDVHNNREQLMANKIIESLVANKLTWTPPAITSDLDNVDRKVSPEQLAIPVPVDSSQMAAIIEGGKGNSFILYGPPGTGKSQTITNLIANALFHGKRVLFVAEKMAALSVVQSRLAKIGLDPFCLELHSNKASKRHVLEQLDKALHVAHIMPPQRYKETAQRIFAQRKDLISYMHMLHDIDPSDGLSLYDCISRYEAIDAEPLAAFSTNATLDNTIASNGTNALEELLGSQLDTVLRLVGQPSQHPLQGLFVDQEMLMSQNQAIARMTEAMQSLAKCDASRNELSQVHLLRDKILRDYNPQVLQQDTRELYDRWRAAKAKWFIPRFFAKRKFLKEMRQFNPFATMEQMDAITNDLLTYSDCHNTMNDVRALASNYFGIELPEDQIPDSAWLTSHAEKLNMWVKNAAKMHDWHHWCEYSRCLTDAGLGCVVSAFNTGNYTAASMHDSLFKALFKTKATEKMNSSSLLATFEGMMFDERIKTYKRLNQEFQLLTQKELYARLASRIPQVGNSVDSNSEIGLLNRNVSNRGRGVSLRELFDQIPTLLQRLCPCMLMSPMSVAQYLDLQNNDKFDLVVFDEASQMPTSEAVGAIARGKSLIVVGDPKQMPPTSFFSSTTVDEDDAAIDDMESILEDCRTLEIPSLQLNWHYRSRHESLIAFSNNEYYDGNLITFPSVDDQQTKVHLIPVDGFYDKGGRRSNHAEAEAIANEIERRLRDPQLCRLSIGVIAFSVVQQALIEDILQERLDNDNSLREAADSMYEPLFVKNLENVQGDERDVILFSIGYGPNKEGKVSMNFGPLNNAGGERRLNVAVSRARREMLVFSTLKSSHIDLSRSKARGVEGLKHFLEYAENQSLAISATNNSRHDNSTIAHNIAAALCERGYNASTGIGRSKFKVDIAVSDKSNPGVYRLGILLDGISYRDTMTTRDREVVQPSVLQGLDWIVMRVWSVDWFNNPQRVIDRIIECMDTPPDTPPQGTIDTFDISKEALVEIQSNGEEYEYYDTTEDAACAMSDYRLAIAIVNVEQPILKTTLCRRMTELRGAKRLTTTLQKSVASIVDKTFYTQPDRDTLAIWASKVNAMTYSQYRYDSKRDITEIPLAEIKNAIREGISEQIALPTHSLQLIVARKLGFARRGTNLERALNIAVKELKETGFIEENDGKLRFTQQ